MHKPLKCKHNTHSQKHYAREITLIHTAQLQVRQTAKASQSPRAKLASLLSFSGVWRNKMPLVTAAARWRNKAKY